MADVIAVDLGDGTVIHAEVTPLGEPAGFSSAPPGGHTGVRGRTERAAEALPLRLEAVSGLLRGVGRWAVDAIKEVGPARPDMFEVEFGFRIAVKSGRLIGVVAEAGGEAAFTVRMGWHAVGSEHRLANVLEYQPVLDSPPGGPTNGNAP